MPSLYLPGGANTARAGLVKTVISTSTTSNNGAAWSKSVSNFDFSNSYFHAVFNVDGCTGDGETIISFGNQQINTSSTNLAPYYTIAPGFHVYYTPNSKPDWHHSTGTFPKALWIDLIFGSNSEDGVYKIKGDITGDVTLDVKSDGVYLNGEKLFESSALSDFFATGSKTLYYSNSEGGKRSNAIYKELSVVKDQQIVVPAAQAQENVLLSQTSSNNGEKWSKETTLDFANQTFHVEMDLSDCTKSSGNYNLLSIGNRRFSSGDYYSIYPGYHVYYSTNKNNETNVLWFDRVTGDRSANDYQFPIPNIVTGSQKTVTLDVKSDGIYVNGEKKINSSDLSSFFATGSHTLYYSNQEGTSQESYATYKNISVITTGSYVDNYLQEGADNSLQLSNTPSNVTVALERTLGTGYWNTFCVPFSISNSVVKEKFGSDVELRKYSGVSGSVMSFAACNDEDIQAGVPYLVKVSNNVANPIFSGVSITSTTPSRQGADGYYMVGTYGTTTLATDGTNLFLGDGDKFYKPSTTGNVMKGMRAYFEVPSSTNPQSLVAKIDGVVSSLSEIDGGEAVVADSRVYNLNGQCVGTSLSQLKRGIYIQNGKKVVVR